MCHCLHNTAGQHCANCTQAFYINDEVSRSDVNACLPCNCHVNGTEPENLGGCGRHGGRCGCKPGVRGRRCDRCRFSEYGPVQGPQPCLPCDCNAVGTAPTIGSGNTRTPRCDAVTGTCNCIESNTGPKCSACRTGWYSPDGAEDGVCLSCDAECSGHAGCISGGVSMAACNDECRHVHGFLFPSGEPSEILHCLASCPSTHYDDGVGQCQECDPLCDGCTGPGPSTATCSRCAHVALGTVCLAECPRHHIDIDGICQQCHPECAGACSGTTERDCDRCRHHLEDGACVGNCSANTYESPIHGRAPDTTSELDAPGESGDGDGDSGALIGGGNVPATSQNTECLPCDDMCGSCYGNGPSRCTSCSRLAGAAFLPAYFGAAFEGTCVERCPDRGFFTATTPLGAGLAELACEECSQECWDGRCLGHAENCTAGCVNFFHGQRCVAQCPEHTYPALAATGEYLYTTRDENDPTTEIPVVTISDHMCTNCSAGCTRCVGPLEADCVACEEDLVFDGTTCVATCDTGWYNNGGVCSQCPAQCRECHSSGVCASCVHVEFAGRCYAECPYMTFSIETATDDDNSDLCAMCHPQCQGGCDGPEPSDCVECKAQWHAGRCVDGCPVGFAETSERDCEPCSAQCAGGCTGLTSSDCNDCANFQYGDACVALCPINTWQGSHLLGNICHECHSTCSPAAGCGGPTPYDCDDCSPSASTPSFRNSTGACVTTCPAGTFESVDSGSCLTCHNNCRQCTGDGDRTGPRGDCQECSGPIFNNTCVSRCPDRGFYLSQELTCEPCDPQCASQCRGEGPSQCGPGSTSLDHTECRNVAREQTCVPSCDDTTEFESQSERRCLPCAPECDAGCTGGGAHQCVRCLNARHGYDCVENCRQGMFPSVVTGQCTSCDPNCARSADVGESCTGSTAGDCTECASLRRNATCVAGCDLSHEFVFGENCQPCHSQCRLGCTGPGGGDCLACASWSTENGECVADCPSHTTYRNVETTTCEACDPQCDDSEEYGGCRAGTSSDQCNRCGRYVSGDTCVSACPNHHFVATGAAHTQAAVIGRCLQCHPSCGQDGCVGPTASDCNQCTRLTLVHVLDSLNNQSCVDSCPEMTYQDNAMCQQCSQHCLYGCLDGGPDACRHPTSTQLDPTAAQFGCREVATLQPNGAAVCSETCDAGRFPDAFGLCVACNAACGTLGCSDSPENCGSCPTLQYLSPDLGVCLACNQQCVDGCTGPHASDCIACSGSRMDGICIPQGSCNTSTHVMIDSSSLGAMCISCSDECDPTVGCSGQSDLDCGSCRNLELTISSRCVSECPPLHFVEYGTGRPASMFESGTCRQCHASCESGCSGPLAAQCTDCRRVTLRTGECANDCPDGEIVGVGTRCTCPASTHYLHHGECLICDAQCLEGCSGSGPGDCHGDGRYRCRDGLVDRSNTCVRECANNEVPGADGICQCETRSFLSRDVCQPCHRECALGCLGPGADECSGPDGGCRNVVAPTLAAPTGECLPACPTAMAVSGSSMCVCDMGFFFDAAVGGCSNCNPLCSTCSSAGADNCPSCRYNRHNGACVLECPAGFVGDSGRSCTPCHGECHTGCSVGGDPSACTTIQAGGQACRGFRDDTGCLSDCPDGTVVANISGDDWCLSSCPLSLRFTNDPREPFTSVSNQARFGGRCVADCSEFPEGRVYNVHSGNASCSSEEAMSIDQAAAQPLDPQEKGVSPVTVYVMLVCILVVPALVYGIAKAYRQSRDGMAAIASAQIVAAKIQRLAHEPPDTPLELLPPTGGVIYSPSYKNPYAQYAETPMTPSEFAGSARKEFLVQQLEENPQPTRKHFRNAYFLQGDPASPEGDGTLETQI